MNKSWHEYIQTLANAHHLRTDFISQADRLLHHEFLFDNEYAMEATQISYRMDPITWQQTPNGDPEWLYMLKRQEYLLDLLGAYYLTGEVKYRAKMKALVFDWLTHNLQDENTWRTIDTGIRLLNWTSVVAALQADHQLSKAEQSQLDAAVEQQAEYLHDQYIEKYDISNWGVLITTGILTYAARFPDVIRPDLVTWAQVRLDAELRLQVDDQGMQWEQSPLYQLEVWRSTLAVVAAQQANHVPVSPTVMTKMQALHQAIVHDLKPDGTLVQQGDTDALRIDSLYNASAAILHQPNLLVGQVKPVYDFLLLELAQEQWQYPSKTDQALPHHFDGTTSGNFMWRSSWRKDANYWHLYNGALGSGHGHAALGHMDLVLNGEDVLVDPGRYTYVDGTERRFLKSVAAHNTIVLDHKGFTAPQDSWKFAYAAVPLSSQRVAFGAGDVVKLAYLDRSGSVPAIITRYWLSLPRWQTYLILDVVRAAGAHELVRHFQIAPKLRVQAAGSNLGAFMLGSQYVLASTAIEARVAKTLFAPHYNELHHLTRVSYLNQFADLDVQVTAISVADQYAGLQTVAVQQSGETSPASSQLAWGAKLLFQDGTNLLVTFEPENTIVGRKLYWYDGTEAYGTLNLFSRQGQEVQSAWRIL